MKHLSAAPAGLSEFIAREPRTPLKRRKRPRKAPSRARQPARGRTGAQAIGSIIGWEAGLLAPPSPHTTVRTVPNFRPTLTLLLSAISDPP